MNNSYRQRLAAFERIKKEIAATAKSPAEYERRLQALAKKLKL